MCQRQCGFKLFLIALTPSAALWSQPSVTGVRFEGQVVDATTSAPIPGTELRLAPPQIGPEAVPPSAMRFVQADDQGRFQLPDLALGPYRLGAGAVGYRGCYGNGDWPIDLVAPVIAHRADRVCTGCTTLVDQVDKRVEEAGLLHATVSVRLTRASVITGKVTDPSGNPIPRASIVVFDRQAATGAPQVRFLSGMPQSQASAQADNRGVFRTASLGPALTSWPPARRWGVILASRLPCHLLPARARSRCGADPRTRAGAEPPR